MYCCAMFLLSLLLSLDFGLGISRQTKIKWKWASYVYRNIAKFISSMVIREAMRVIDLLFCFSILILMSLTL